MIHHHGFTLNDPQQAKNDDREMKRDGILALLTRVGVVVSVSIYTTDPVTCSPWILTVSTVSPSIYIDVVLLES